MTLHDYIKISGRAELIRTLTISSPECYDDFIKALYEDLDALTGFLESDAKDYADASEDMINRALVKLLKARYYHAAHDVDEGGHVDIHVQSGDEKYSWLGEAKIDKGPKYIQDGLVQLNERYARATPNHHCGGLIVYVQRDRAAEHFATWKLRLAQNEIGLEELEIADCTARQGFAFYSSYIHPRVGRGAPKYTVRHMAVSLYRPASAAAPVIV